MAGITKDFTVKRIVETHKDDGEGTTKAILATASGGIKITVKGEALVDLGIERTGQSLKVNFIGYSQSLDPHLNPKKKTKRKPK